MRIEHNDQPPKKRSVNLTVREDVLAKAKSLNLNASKAAEAGIIQAIREAQQAQWLEDHKAALQAHNKRIHEDGLLLSPHWDDG